MQNDPQDNATKTRAMHWKRAARHARAFQKSQMDKKYYCWRLLNRRKSHGIENGSPHMLPVVLLVILVFCHLFCHLISHWGLWVGVMLYQHNIPFGRFCSVVCAHYSLTTAKLLLVSTTINYGMLSWKCRSDPKSLHWTMALTEKGRKMRVRQDSTCWTPVMCIL